MVNPEPSNLNDLPADNVETEEKEKSFYKKSKTLIILLLLTLLLAVFCVFRAQHKDNCDLKQAGIYLKSDMKKCEKIDENKIIVIPLANKNDIKTGFYYDKSAVINKKYAFSDLPKCTQLSIDNLTNDCK